MALVQEESQLSKAIDIEETQISRLEHLLKIIDE